MKKIIFVCLPALVFAVFVPSASAAVVINEIMYDLPGNDADREWLEVFNDGAEPVDLSGWKLFEANTNHGLTINQGNATIPAGGYAVIADQPSKFLLDWPGFSGTIFDSPFSLNNTGEILALKDDSGTVVDEVSYSSDWGATGDGYSLQKSGTDWLAAEPTPGAANALTSAPPPPASGDSNSGGGADVDSDAGETAAKKTKAAETFKVTLKPSYYGAVHAPLTFQPTLKGVRPDLGLRLDWSFGDGGAFLGPRPTHVYDHPGSYVLVLNTHHGEEEVVTRALVEIVEPTLAITTVSAADSAYPYVELHNTTGKELDLSGWQLQAAGRSFVFPRGTYLAAQQKIRFPGRLTGLYPHDLTAVALNYPDGRIAVTPPRQDGAETQTLATSKTATDLTLARAARDLVLLASQREQARRRLAPIPAAPAPRAPTLPPAPKPSPTVSPAEQLAAPAGSGQTRAQTIVLDGNEPKKSWWQRIFSR